MAEKRPVQHTPAHVGNVPDERHPAASAFAPLQPAAGVVADDVEERGQNLRGGPTASEANEKHKDEPEKLRKQHFEGQAVEPTPVARVEDGEAKPAKSTTKK